MTTPLSPNLSTSPTRPTPAEARLMRIALDLSPTEAPPRLITSARRRWIPAGTHLETERTATLKGMVARGWLVPVRPCGDTPAAVTQLYVTQSGLDALVASERV